ncbi:MAG: hypothetical protein GX434_17060 [Peptococcaceae bacterium]|nr:hypothetical protein [Peptococcaceae bacterium]
MKENLVEIRPGYFLNKNDPQYWRKRLKHLPNDSKAMYHVGVETGKNAEEYLAIYKQTGNKKDLTLSQKKQKEALSLLKKSSANGYLLARSEILRLEEMDIIDNKNKIPKSNFPYKAGLFCIIIGALLAGGLFLALKNRITNVTIIPHYSTFMKTNTLVVPYEVKKEKPKPAQIPDLAYKERIIETNTTDENKLANILVNTVMEEYKNNNSNPVKVVANITNSNSSVPGKLSHDTTHGTAFHEKYGCLQR